MSKAIVPLSGYLVLAEKGGVNPLPLYMDVYPTRKGADEFCRIGAEDGYQTIAIPIALGYMPAQSGGAREQDRARAREGPRGPRAGSPPCDEDTS